MTMRLFLFRLGLRIRSRLRLDCTDSIQRWLDRGGGLVHLPAGRFRTAKGLRLG